MQPMTGELELPQKRPQTRPLTRPLTAAHGRCAGEGDGEDGEAGRTTLTTTVPQSRSPLRRRCDRGAAGGGHTASLHAPASTESALGRSRDRAVIFGGGRVPKSLCCAALPENTRARPIPAGAAARGQSHARHTKLRRAEPPPEQLWAQVGGISSTSTGGHPAKVFRCTTALRPRAHPCHGASRRPSPPNHTVQTWGGRPRIGRGGGCPPAKTVSRPPPPPQSPTMSAACTSNGICGHSWPHAGEF